jgi:hypothetical protein
MLRMACGSFVLMRAGERPPLTIDLAESKPGDPGISRTLATAG